MDVTHPLLPALRAARIIPVLRTESAANAARAVLWLREAGVSVFEITLTIPDAVGLIRELAREPGLLVGAGTVPDRGSAEACLAAGARFLVAPWVDAEVATASREAGALALLGALTPTEVRAALAAGADAVKIFPAASAGGPPHLRALGAVFPGVAFCPTGGIDARSAPEYFAAGAAFLGVGGRLVDDRLIERGERGAVVAAAQQLLGLVQV